MPRPDALSNREARWVALEAQGLSAPRRQRAHPAGTALLRRLMEQVGTIQVDAVNVVARTQFLVPFSRLGAYDQSAMVRLSGPHRPWFEYWGHAASLLPVALHPLLRWRMERHAALQHWQGWLEVHRDYAAAVLEEVRERGALRASELDDPRRRQGEWWARRSDGRTALEYHFSRGALAAWRTASFERVYDIPERVIPAEILAQPVPEPEAAQRDLLHLAAQCLGVATAADLADYFWIPIVSARARVAELVEEGRLLPVTVEGWRQPAFVPEGLAPARTPRREHATVLSPFDSLIWRRPRTETLFNFHYRIEIYVPQPKRVFGYYVLPLLLGDELVARFDLKSDRARRQLRVLGAYAEQGHEPVALAGGAATELRALAAWLGLEAGVDIVRHGNLATTLARAAKAKDPSTG